jgi:hypothetical protein
VRLEHLGLFLAASAICFAPADARSECLDPPGDVNGNGIANIVDVQCALLTNLWVLAGSTPGAEPGCLGGQDPILIGDANCDSTVDVSDITIFIKTALGTTLGVIDSDGDFCPDACEAPPPNAADCCNVGGSGCGEAACEACVCLADPTCCSATWDAECVMLAEMECAGPIWTAVVPLSGAQEVPPKNTAATGSAVTTLFANGMLRWNITHTVSNPSAAHIHSGAAGSNGPVLIGFANAASPIVGSAMLTPAQVDLLLAGNLYFNVHSPTFPSGEIRGQIMLSEAPGCACAGAGNGCEVTAAPGASVEACESCVCDADAFCCEVTWDPTCVAAGQTSCFAACGCEPEPEPGNCCEATEAAGCLSAPCESCVCAADSFCCEVFWDNICVSRASGECNGLCDCIEPPAPSAADCCNDVADGACGEASCTDCVCGIDPFCCDVVWDGLCAETAQMECAGAIWTATVALNGANEVPPRNTQATGTATLVLYATGELLWSIEHNVAAVTAGHFHIAPAGSNGPVTIGFPSPASPIVGAALLNQTQLDALLAGNIYINIHSTTFPGGEIRGQVMMMETQACSCAGAGDGCDVTAAPGSTNEACEDCVCAADAFCCNVTWDLNCVAAASAECGMECMCASLPPGNCCEATAASGCGNSECEMCVCGLDPTCCNVAWDGFCVDTAATDCNGTCACAGPALPSVADCCNDGGLGCGEAACADCVCGLDPFCCDTSWDSTCADASQAACAVSIHMGTVSLSGANEVPPNNSTATGSGDFMLYADGVLTWSITHTVANASAAHIHIGPAGSNGPVVIGFASPASPIEGAAQLTAPQIAALLSGGLYVNVHSPAHPGGEVRGQIMTMEMPACSCAGASDGCTATPDAPGATVEMCEMCVCGLDPFCCELGWDGVCVQSAETECSAECQCP